MSTWDEAQIQALFELPFHDLLFRAQSTHRQHFDPNGIQISTLLSVKTGACPEDCAYCPQSVKYETGLDKEKLMATETVVAAAKKAKAAGATRFCMGAAWRNAPSGTQFQHTLDMIKAVKDLGMETCFTMGMLNAEQAQALKDNGLDYYNHNLDTSEEYYKEIITTRSYQDRLDTLAEVSKSGLKTCCGGIIGMGESREDRIQFLLQLAKLPEAPQSIPINRLVRVAGTPLADVDEIDDFEFVRTIAIARIMFPTSYVRLSAGREDMNDAMQALCFHAGANSLFYGEKLLTTPNPSAHHDSQLFERLGMKTESLGPPTDIPSACQHQQPQSDTHA